MGLVLVPLPSQEDSFLVNAVLKLLVLGRKVAGKERVNDLKT